MAKPKKTDQETETETETPLVEQLLDLEAGCDIDHVRAAINRLNAVVIELHQPEPA
jgi:hypothetical protein